MELKAGYKRTEVGVIPEDWDAVPLNSIGQFKNGINKGSEAFGHGSPFVNLMDVFGVSDLPPFTVPIKSGSPGSRVIELSLS